MHPRASEFAERAHEEHGIEVEVREFPEGTKTARDAAEAIGCDVAQIASSLAFAADGNLVVVVTSGANRVDEDRLGDHLGVGSVTMADADRVKAELGWSIGGVPPFCHDADVPVLVDETLLDHDVVWAAAGTPDAVFPIDPQRLVEVAGADPAAVAG